MRIVSFDVGIKNLAVCVLEKKEGSPGFDIIDWKILHLVDRDKKMGRVNIQELADKIYFTLHEEFDSAGYIDHVLIENQPVMKNPVMKTVQMLIFGYFQGGKVASKVGSIHLMSARSKLNVSKVVRVTDMKTSYQNNKKSSVATTREYLRESSSSLCIMEGNKKKDDLCDAFLQAVYFTEHMK